MKVLVLNSGSSSLKSQYFVDGEAKASVLVEEISQKSSHIRIKYSETKKDYNLYLEDHNKALEVLFELLIDNKILDSISSLDAVGHRVVHGGSMFNKPTLIDNSVIEGIRSLIPLAPLHNPANLQAIEILHNKYPDMPQVAIFDTSFHQTMPKYAYTYAIPHELSDNMRIRRYGFHGTSHHYVAKEAAKYMNKELKELNLLTLHLGNGGSIAAIKNGECVDTTMGMTPLEGLIMGTRSGDIDPAIIPYIVNNSNNSLNDVDNILNKQSGLKGICGSSDMREIEENVLNGDEASILALDMYVYRIRKYIGSYCVTLGHIDAIIFTGGIGENSDYIRNKICENLTVSLGIDIDQNKNSNMQDDINTISTEDSKIKIYVISTNEELQIALETEECLKDR
ncbi:Acetate kinase [hydrothermal vent metagenome]|uniref:Acetate kinase n=1 Tax=hydrothermal vent metagenome TaxID=652676 RepID=A0A1W1EDZ1_9ZZZZ